MKISKLLMGVAALLLLLSFFFPIWSISLFAPQYPDGVTLNIWINKIDGDTEGTLQNVNILNHYVGMKEINPDSFKELLYFPYIIVGLSLLGLLFTGIGNNKLYLVWCIILCVAGILGVYDFYLWEYEYGHDLNPNAAIKMPGMAYQPPLIGSKMILNFTAVSFPNITSYIYACSIVLSFLAFRLNKKGK